MKNIIIISFFLGIGISSFSQSFDTIRYDDGKMMVINSQDQKKIEDNLKIKKSAVLEGNYRIFDTENNVIEKMVILEYDEGHYQKLKWKKGIKVWEEYGKFDDNYIYTLIWDDKGNIQFQQHVINNTQVRIDYFDEAPYNIYHLKKFKIQERKLGLKFVEQESLNYWVEIKDISNSWVPFGDQMKYYSNGNLKSKGSYLQAKFEIYETEEEYINSLTNSEIEPISERGFAKNGEWVYYNENGEISYKEQYKNGQKIK